VIQVKNLRFEVNRERNCVYVGARDQKSQRGFLFNQKRFRGSTFIKGTFEYSSLNENELRFGIKDP
jgi:hypothetical protein